MRTIILPGQSIKNKAWAEEIAKQIGLTNFEIINWEHWKDGSDRPLDIELETRKVLDAIGSQDVQILAKSIGTLITAKILEKIPSQITKIILCGLPLNFLNEEKSAYKIFADFAADKIIVIQNENDTAGLFSEAKDFFYKINPKIPIISKPRADHSYPYPEDFRNFLLS